MIIGDITKGTVRKTISMVIGIILLSFYISSCATFKRCNKKFNTGETYTVQHTDTVREIVKIHIPQDTLYIKLNKSDTSGTATSQKGRLKVKTRSTKEYIYISAECAADTIIKHVEIPIRSEIECPKTVIWEEKPTKFQIILNKAKNISFYLIIILILIQIIRSILKKYLLFCLLFAVSPLILSAQVYPVDAYISGGFKDILVTDITITDSSVVLPVRLVTRFHLEGVKILEKGKFEGKITFILEGHQNSKAHLLITDRYINFFQRGQQITYRRDLYREAFYKEAANVH